MWWHGWKKDGKWMRTCWEMGSGWKIWKLDGHGQVSWWSLYCLAHFQMRLHMFALTSESPVFCFLSLSLFLITAHPAWRTEWSSDPRLTKQALILSSGAGYYWYHLPAYHAKIPAALSTSANERDGVRASVIQERQTQHTFENIATLDGLDNMRWEIPYTKGPICDPSCSTTSLVMWCHESPPPCQALKVRGPMLRNGGSPNVLHVF